MSGDRTPRAPAKREATTPRTKTAATAATAVTAGGATAVTTATLLSGGLETRYERAGAGAPVLLLAPGGVDERGQTDSLVARLSARFRVIHPVGLPRVAERQGRARGRPASLPVVSWLRGLIDGLGLGRCALVATDPFCLDALGFALGDTERVSALVLLHRREPDPGAPAMVAGRLEGSRQRLLVIGRSGRRNGAPVPAGMAREIEAFLLGGGEGPGGPENL